MRSSRASSFGWWRSFSITSPGIPQMSRGAAPPAGTSKGWPALNRWATPTPPLVSRALADGRTRLSSPSGNAGNPRRLVPRLRSAGPLRRNSNRPVGLPAPATRRLKEGCPDSGRRKS
jgi:hypothetical protein